MKSFNSRSLRSVRSARSVKSGKTENEIPSLDNMLITACEKFHFPYTVIVKKEMKQDYNNRASKHSERRVTQNKAHGNDLDEYVDSDKTSSSNIASENHVNTIIITFIYDIYKALTDIRIDNVRQLPQILLSILSLLIPHYINIERIIINNCGINMYTIHELSKILKMSTVTEIFLDGSPLAGADYSMLFESLHLRSLSLCRCKINDDACELIASKLHHLTVGENLLLLNLSSNHITDKGAKHFADALRTNRHLRYLNLADNHIYDNGAGYILDVLMEYPLTQDEIKNMRRRHIEYLKCKQILMTKYLSQYRNRSIDESSQLSRKSTMRKKKSSATTVKSKISVRKEKERPSSANLNEDFIKTKAELMTTEILGPFIDPFHPDCTKIVDGAVHSFGNLTLAYLNLAYNNLSYLTIKKLQRVVLYQNGIRSSNQTGLIKVVLDGNNLPVSCLEMSNINDLLLRKVWQLSSAKVFGHVRRKSRPSKFGHD